MEKWVQTCRRLCWDCILSSRVNILCFRILSAVGIAHIPFPKTASISRASLCFSVFEFHIFISRVANYDEGIKKHYIEV